MIIDKYTIISAIAPIAAPVAPATVLINTLYQSMVTMNVEHNIALISAVSSGVGAELSGMVAAYAAVQAYRKKKGGHFVVSILAFLAYVIFIGAGIALGHNPAPLIIVVLISIIAYLGVAVLEDLFRETTEKKDDTQKQIELNKSEAEKEKARASGLRAQAKIALAEQPATVRSVRSNNRTAEQNAKLEAVRQAMAELQAAGEKITTRAVAAKTGMSNSTASVYMAEIGVQK